MGAWRAPGEVAPQAAHGLGVVAGMFSQDQIAHWRESQRCDKTRGGLVA